MASPPRSASAQLLGLGRLSHWWYLATRADYLRRPGRMLPCTTLRLRLTEYFARAAYRRGRRDHLVRLAAVREELRARGRTLGELA